MLSGLERRKFIWSLVGAPYAKNAKGPTLFDCWHLVVYVEKTVFDRHAPEIAVPEHADWRWMIEQFTTHQELNNWIERVQVTPNMVTAIDGAVVLMARTKQPAHCGIWLQEERGILHAD